jgi:hypothetical protein
MAAGSRRSAWRPDGDILRCSEETVDEDADEGRIETVLNGQSRNLCIRHALRHHNNSNGDAGDEI